MIYVRYKLFSGFRKVKLLTGKHLAFLHSVSNSVNI